MMRSMPSLMAVLTSDSMVATISSKVVSPFKAISRFLAQESETAVSPMKGLNWRGDEFETQFSRQDFISLLLEVRGLWNERHL